MDSPRSFSRIIHFDPQKSVFLSGRGPIGDNAMLNESQLRDFERDGCLVVRDVVDAPVLRSVREKFAGRAEFLLRQTLRVLGMRAVRDFGDFGENVERLIRLAPRNYEHLDISLPMDHNLAARVPAWKALFGAQWEEEAGLFADESVHRLLTHPNIAAIVRQLVGENAVASPVQHARIKPPQRRIPSESANDANYARTLWHQDEAVVHEGARGANILTVWIAVTDAAVENGCMFCVPGSHLDADDPRKPDFGLKTHCPGKQLVGEIYIPEALVPREKQRPLEARAGDIVLLHRRTAHGAGPNQSDQIRWSFDLRYQPADSPTGRECFPAFPADETGPDGAKKYRQQWLDARDKIIRGDISAVFNERWMKYQSAPLCA